jgi:predicted NBD/HSP70 family sugar kinase
VGADLGGTKLLLVAEGPQGRTVARLATGLGFAGADLERALHEFIASLGARPESLGVAVPGLVGPDGTVVACDTVPRLPGWRAPELATVRPAVLVNDVEAALWAERDHLPPQATAAVIMLGTGIGAALLVEGRRAQGANGWAGELGSIPLAAGEQARTLDQVASGAALLERVGRPLEEALAAAAAGERDVLDAVRTAGAAAGLGLATVVNLLNPSILVLGGGLLRWPGYREAALRAAERAALPDLWRACTVRSVTHGELTVALGALAFAAADGEGAGAWP